MERIFGNIIGNITKNAELKTSKLGNQYLQFSVAVNKGKDENKTTTYYDVITRLVNLEQSIVKGALVSVCGDLEISTYRTQSGETRISRTFMLPNITVIRSNSQPQQGYQQPQDQQGYQPQGILAAQQNAWSPIPQPQQPSVQQPQPQQVEDDLPF